ncbi:MAG: hypothetical protein ACTSSG_11565 [Candidatus Heimdallarchaeaceae archaeon]
MEASKKWDEITETFLRDEFAAMKEIREIILKINRIQEDSKEGYQKK